MEDKFLFKNKWLSLKKKSDPSIDLKGYVYSHESRCNGQIISILPHRYTNHGMEYLFRLEMTPCWDVYRQTASTLTGGVEGFPRDDAIRELREESGYKITDDELIFLGNSYGSKSSDTVYSLFTVDLTGKKHWKATGDGSLTEAKGSVFWGNYTHILNCKDPQASVIRDRLMIRRRTGLVLGKFMPVHNGHKYLLDYAKKKSEELIIVLGSLPSDEIDPKIRLGWLRDVTGENTEVLEIPNNNPPGVKPGTKQFYEIWRDNLRNNLPYVPAILYASEEYGRELANYMGMKFVMVDKQRKHVPISATEIRNNPVKYKKFIPDVVKKFYNL